MLSLEDLESALVHKVVRPSSPEVESSFFVADAFLFCEFGKPFDFSRHRVSTVSPNDDASSELLGVKLLDYINDVLNCPALRVVTFLAFLVCFEKCTKCLLFEPLGLDLGRESLVEINNVLGLEQILVPEFKRSSELPPRKFLDLGGQPLHLELALFVKIAVAPDFLESVEVLIVK